jgi:FkbH-like protein
MENEVHSQTIVITATFTAEPVGDSLLLLFKRLGIVAGLKFAPYNQVFQQLLDPVSLTCANQNGANVFLLRLEDWGIGEPRNNGKTPVPDVENIERSAADFVHAISSVSARSTASFVVVVCPPSGAAKADSRFSDLLANVEELICGELDKLSGVVFVSSNALAAAYPVSEYDDPQGNRLGRIPYTELFFTALGALIARRIYALQSAPRKVIVLDCDQTLWKGVCGEDGPLGIEIDPPRRALQEFLIKQHDSGMLLCVCSKNNEEDVLEVFNQQPEMPLKREHILSWRINWQPKSQNLRSLADELNVSLDSFIFVDDDSAVCAEVRAHCPEVLTLQLPRDSAKIADFIRNIWAFDRPKQTYEDKQRTQLYRQSRDREQLRKRSVSLPDFLDRLELKIEMSPLQYEEISRASQLSQRTNQFNFTTIRLSEQEIEGMCRTGEADCLVVRVTDRFGDYGMVGLMIFKKENGAFLVETFLLSCRALGRGVEHEMLARLGEICQERGIEQLSIQFRKTPKNRPALEFIRELGAKNEIEEGDWCIGSRQAPPLV